MKKMELDIEIGVQHQCNISLEGETKRICNICLESEEKEEMKWETPCTKKHIYCKDCIIQWMKQCKGKKKKFTCPVCREELDETIYMERELDRRIEEVVNQSNQQRKISRLISHIFFGFMIPLGMLMLLVYVINTVKNKISCVFASFFIIFMLFLYMKTYNLTLELQPASVHPL